jgi:hypothetical protein
VSGEILILIFRMQNIGGRFEDLLPKLL